MNEKVFVLLQILQDHTAEVWHCSFSPNGLKLATASKDMTVIIWDFYPETYTIHRDITLGRHSLGISFIAWSPDSTRVALCGPEGSDVVRISIKRKFWSLVFVNTFYELIYLHFYT